MGDLANELLEDLVELVDDDEPVTRDVTMKLNEFADTVAAGSPSVRESVLENGAYAAVCRAWIYCCYSGTNTAALAPGSKQCRNAVLRCLCALTAGHPDIIDDVGWQIIAHGIDKATPEPTLLLVLKLLRNIFIKSEENREQFCWYQDLFAPLLSLTSKSKISDAFLLEWCSALKALVLFDDVREACNRSAERKKVISSANILPNLSSRLNLHNIEDDEKSQEAMNAIVLLLSSMAIIDDLRLLMDSGNVIPGIHNLYRLRGQNRELMMNTTNLLRHLCCNRQIRDTAATYALMKYVVNILNEFQGSTSMVEVTMACIANMTLSCACHVAQFISKGGLPLTLQVMTRHINNVKILKSACLTLRNVIEVGGDSIEKMKEIGFTLFLSGLLSHAPQIAEFYVIPVLTHLEESSTAILDQNRVFTAPMMVPRVPRKSIVVDDDEKQDNAMKLP